MSRKTDSVFKRVLHGLAAVGLLLLLLLHNLPASAQEGWLLHYAEDFSDQDRVYKDWFLEYRDESNNWRPLEGMLLGSGYASAHYEQGEWQDQELRYSLYLYGTLVTNLRLNGDQRYILYLSRVDDYTITYRALRQYGDDDFSPDLLDGSISTEPGAQLRVSFMAQGGYLRLRLEHTGDPATFGAPLEVEYFEEDGLLMPGKFSFEIEGGQAWIDDLELWAPPELLYLSGTIYEGGVDDRRFSLEGMEVGLYGSYSSYPEEGKLIATSVSNADGFYSLPVPQDESFYYYNIITSGLPGFTHDGALSVGGETPISYWIQYSGPIHNEMVLTDNDFWYYRLPTETPSDTPTGTITPSATPTITPQPSDTPAPDEPTPDVIEPSHTPRPLVVITPTPPDNGWVVPVLVVGGLAALGVAGLGGGYLLVRGLRRPPAPRNPPPRPQQPPDQPPDEPRQPDRPPLLPFIPPLRLVRVWLSENNGGVLRPVNNQQALTAGAPYNLHVQVTPRGLPPDKQEISSAAGLRKLNVVCFTPDDFLLEATEATLDLPRSGESNELRQVMRPRRPGRAKCRVNVYYGNVLLQSALLEADVVQRGQAEIPAQLTRQLDYVANSDLSGLVGLRQPDLSIFTNQVSDGTHWIGVFEAGTETHPPHSHMLTLGAAQLAARAEAARELLLEIEGAQSYRFSALLPIDEPKLRRLEDALVRLAIHGWELFHSLFIGSENEVSEEWLAQMRRALFRPGTISIARCRGDNPGLPWAAIYSQRLLPSRRNEIHLCEEFKRQISANVWSADGKLLEKHDLLNDPPACQALPHCPLKGSQNLVTVCPFGFWGLKHQVEQPIQLVTPTPVDQIPPELTNRQGKPDPAAHRQSPYILRHAQGSLEMAVGIFQDIPGAAGHSAEISALGQGITSVTTPSAEQMRQFIEHGSQQIIYFYCHGDQQGGEFKLKLGSNSQPGFLGASDLDPMDAVRPRDLHALAILNGCQTLAIAPERMQGFLATLRRLGFAGVVGSETPVYPPLARPFGNQLLQRLAAGQSLGEAFLGLRRELQRQGNPLGMIYTYYAPSALHLHSESGCAFCLAHPPDQAPS